MSAQKNTLAALLAAAVIVVPAAVEAKPGKDRGGQGGGHEQSRGDGGGGEFRGAGNKHREARQSPQAMDRPARAPRQAFQGRGVGGKHREARQARRAMERVASAPRQASETRGTGKQSRVERSARAERFAIGGQQQRETAKPKRSQREREPHRAVRAAFDATPHRGAREVASYMGDSRRFPGPQLSRKVEKQIARQQRAAYRAEAKQERQWSRHQRQVLAVAPVAIYPQSFATYTRDVHYAYGPTYRASPIRAFSGYPTYPAAYDYAPRYASNEAYRYGSWSYPQNYSGWSDSPSYAVYSPYDAGYGNNGLDGLFGGGGGLGDILVALLPLLLGDNLGLGGLTGGGLDTGILGNTMSGFAGSYGPSSYSPIDYAEPTYPYHDATVIQGWQGADQVPLGGEGLVSLLPLALQSGLFGGEFGGIGAGLLGLGGNLGAGDGLGMSGQGLGYSPTDATNAGVLGAFGL